MEEIYIDWLAVSLAAAFHLIISYCWYSSWLFGHVWCELTCIDRKKIKMSWRTICLALSISFLSAFFLAFLQAHLSITTVIDGMFLGFCVWLGFVMTTQLATCICGRSSFRVFFIDTGCKLLSFLVMGGIIGA